MKNKVKDIKILAAKIRQDALRAMVTTGGGHVGGSMSMADLMACLYGELLKYDAKNPKWEERDRLVVSKGHSGPALYGALAESGFFPKDWLDTVNLGGTRLPSHCDMNLTPGIDMSTGSLGQGVSTAIGIAWGMKYLKKPNMTYLVIGDGEAEEGQVWEGAMFAAQNQLDHLIAFVDYNKKQLDGYTKDICDLGDIRKKFEDFGWDAVEVNGHDIKALCDTVKQAKETPGKPHMIVLNTIKGKDCSFAEDELYNHHMKFGKEKYQEAVNELQKQIDMLTAKEA